MLVPPIVMYDFSHKIIGTCPVCGDNEYCDCSTDYECRCNYNITGSNGSCKGTNKYYNRVESTVVR